jgi:hypothetical protein
VYKVRSGLDAVIHATQLDDPVAIAMRTDYYSRWGVDTKIYFCRTAETAAEIARASMLLD